MWEATFWAPPPPRPSLVSLSVQTPSAAQTANRGHKKRAKTFLPPRSLGRSSSVLVRLAFFLPPPPPDDDDDDEGGGVDAL